MICVHPYFSPISIYNSYFSRAKTRTSFIKFISMGKKKYGKESLSSSCDIIVSFSGGKALSWGEE